MEEKSCDKCVWKENECYGEEICEHYTEKPRSSEITEERSY